MLEWFSNLKKKFWEWMDHSGTILVAISTSIVGAFTAVLGMIDWSPLWSTLGTGTYLSKEQTVTIGAAMIIKGIIDYIVRKSNTIKTETGKLISNDVTTAEVKAAKKNAK